MRVIKLTGIILLITLLIIANLTTAKEEPNKPPLKLSSSAFQKASDIPSQYTCDGSNISPQLSWEGVPATAKTLVLIMNDPDAPGGESWDHWVLFNIPANTTSLAEGVADLPRGTEVGRNSWRNTKYSGPCPPSGTHRYVFTLYALDTILTLPAASSSLSLLKAMQGHILAHTELMGRYKRSSTQ